MMNIRRSYLFLFFLSVAFSVESKLSQSMEYDPLLTTEQSEFINGTVFAVDDDKNVTMEEPSSFKLASTDEVTDQYSNGTDLLFTEGFVATFTVIVVSELGDKTFFIAAIMAMTNPRALVLAGAMMALGCLHIVESCFGFVITYIPRVYTFYFSATLFLFFGVKMMRDGCKMKIDEAEDEFEEVQMEVKKKEDEDIERVRSASIVSAEGLPIHIPLRVRLMTNPKLRVVLEAITLTFLAEFGDRSQLATVVLATSHNVWGVIVGGLLGHFICTGLAVLSGKLIASKISTRTLTLVGAIIFIIFASAAFVEGP